MGILVGKHQHVKTCSKCGETGLAWGHDTDRPGRRFCQACATSGTFVLVNRAGDLHSLTCSGRVRAATPQPETPTASAERLPMACGCLTGTHPPYRHAEWAGVENEVDEGPAVATICRECKKVQTPGMRGIHTPTCSIGQRETESDRVPVLPGMDDDKAKALQALADLLAPKVDRAEVEGWARDAIAETERDLRERISEVLTTIHAPTVVKVEREGEVRAIEGSTHAALADVLCALASGEHVMMVGPAGTGKSTIAHQASTALDRPFYAISLSPQTPASSLLGYQDANGRYVRSLFREAYECGGVFLFDEIDNGHPSILAVMNSALSNGTMAFPDGMVERHPTFLCVASANTYGRGADRQYVGRSPIDAATLDRFTVLDVGYDLALEDALAAATGYDAWPKVAGIVRALRANAEGAQMTVVCSPRATVGMCRLLAQGMTWDKAVAGRLRRGLSDTDWAKMSNGVRVAL